jgi:molecular chaperone DnaK (HSP70)
MSRALAVGIAFALAGCKSESRPPALGESIAVEQPGGSVTQLIEQGTEIPTSATEGFTTSRDDEKKIGIHVLRGTGRTVGKLRSDGWWMVDGVNPGKAGDQQIQVTFEVDGQGRLSVSARQDDRKLKVTRVDSTDVKLKPAALVEPGDVEDAQDDPE